MKKMLLVFNPKAGRGDFVRNLYKVVELYTRAGYEIVVYPTGGSGDAHEFILERGAAFDLVVCSGGDGMINEAVNACMRIQNPPPLAYIPSGTVNDFAATLKFPRDILKSARFVVTGQPRMIDAGVLSSPVEVPGEKYFSKEKYFSYVAAFGLFTNIPYTTDQKAKNILGRTAYFLEGIKYLANVPSVKCVIKVDEEASGANPGNNTIEGNFMLGIIANATSIGGFRFNVEESAAIDDGFFEVIFIHSPKNIIELQEIVAALLGNQTDPQLVIKRRARKIEFSSAEPCDWTLDGEFGGRHENLTITNLHKKLNIVLPKQSK